MEPGGIGADETSLYVADTNNHAIRRIELDSRRVSTIRLRRDTGFVSRGGDHHRRHQKKDRRT
jgi:sugar lactone lactonase YvrE